VEKDEEFFDRLIENQVTKMVTVRDLAFKKVIDSNLNLKIYQINVFVRKQIVCVR